MRSIAKTVSQQALTLEKLPNTTSITLKRGRVSWRGKLQPTPLSLRYTIQIDYAPPKPPIVAVIAPQLEAPSDRKLPHVFHDGTLCLCYAWQWRACESIAATFVPWTSEWLLHYELWKFTAVWHGGGHGSTQDSLRNLRGS